MALTAKQKDSIILMDKEAKQLSKHGNDEVLLMALTHKMPQIKEIINCSYEGELNFYCQRYEGFYQYMKLLERMAASSSQGVFNDM